MSENRSYEYHGTDDLVENEHQRLARITGLDEATVAAAFDRPAGGTLPPEPIPGVLRTDAELEDAYIRVERGEAAEAELAYRAMVNDCSPVDVYIDDDLDAA